MTSLRKQVQEQFKLRAEKFENSAGWITDEGLLQLHFDMVHKKNNYKLLELCCGTGIVGSRFVGNVQLVVGADISPQMLKIASNKLDLCLISPAEELPFSNCSFDIVICRQALHFLDLNNFIKGARRVLKPGGQLLVSQIVPFGKDDSDWLYKIHKAKQPQLKNFVSEQEVIDLVKNNGFDTQRIENYYTEESINNWLVFSPELSEGLVKQTKKLFADAPASYKKVHKTRIKGDDIIDLMRWVLVNGVKR